MGSPLKKSDERTNGPVAYREHIIIHNAIAGRWYIKRDGHNMGSAATLDEAKAVIDSLID